MWNGWWSAVNVSVNFFPTQPLTQLLTFSSLFLQTFPGYIDLSLRRHWENIRSEKVSDNRIIRYIDLVSLSKLLTSAYHCLIPLSKHGHFYQHLCTYQPHWKNRCCFGRSMLLQSSYLSSIILPHCWVSGSKARRVDESV